MKIAMHPSTQIDAMNEVTSLLTIAWAVFIVTCYLQQGETALHLACIHDQANMVELLLKRGADIKIRDKVALIMYIYNLVVIS